MRFSHRTQLAGCAVLAAAGLAGCASKPDPLAYTRGEFSQTDTYSRTYPLPAESVCEGGRRALLSQGYALADPTSSSRAVEGHKQFQNTPENHREITFRLVCEPDHVRPGHSVAFVSAVEAAYALKKTNNSASLGVGLLGSLSMPFSSSDDSMVQVGSETISSAAFYGRFFTLLERYVPPAPPQPKAEAAPAKPAAPPPPPPPEPAQAVPVPQPQPQPEAPAEPNTGPDSHQLDSPHLELVPPAAEQFGTEAPAAAPEVKP